MIDTTATNTATNPAAPPPGLRTRRLFGAATSLGCAAVLAMAAYMTPSASGLGTHTQLNLPACGWITVADMPCMTCGMTTAFSHAVRGEFLSAFLTQPMGFLLAVSTAMALVLGLHVALTGANLAGMLAGFWQRRTLWIVLGIGLGSWAYKILIHKGVL